MKAELDVKLAKAFVKAMENTNDMALIFFEEGGCRFDIQRTTHDVPGDRDIVLFGIPKNLFSEDLKESFIFDRADGESSFWAIISKSSSLTSSYSKSSDFTGFDSGQASFLSFAVESFLV